MPYMVKHLLCFTERRIMKVIRQCRYSFKDIYRRRSSLLKWIGVPLGQKPTNSPLHPPKTGRHHTILSARREIRWKICREDWYNNGPKHTKFGCPDDLMARICAPLCSGERDTGTIWKESTAKTDNAWVQPPPPNYSTCSPVAYTNCYQAQHDLQSSPNPVRVIK